MKAILFTGKQDKPLCLIAPAPFLMFYFHVCLGYCGPPCMYKNKR
jgi:hypothetical protein